MVKNNYQSILNLLETEIAIKYVKDTFEKELAKSLKLTRVSAPLFVLPGTGLNDNLNGYERAVSFDIPSIKKTVEIVHSLAKWKRMALNKYRFQPNTGLYTDMNAIRRDEELDSLHSVYVDQWDWERIINEKQRNFNHLVTIVKKIYQVLLKTEKSVCGKFTNLPSVLPKDITFISTKELEERWPNHTPKERENLITKENGAVFVHQIGWPLKDGMPHDGRAADYDDWNLNGDILVWYDVLECAYEISSMGIRVNSDSLVKQLKYKNEESKLNNWYSQAIINNQLPLTLGGGIGQSRLCMFFLKKAHIGEVQVSVWDDDQTLELTKQNINLL